MDYRIIKFENVRENYIQFLKEREFYQKNSMKNEFEPAYNNLENLYNDIGFKFKSIIVYFFPYYKEIDNENSNLSIHAISEDYHYICKKILNKYKKEIIGDYYNSYIQCDNGFFNERFFALNSGLCMKGMNGMAIHEKYGSYGFLGIIATDKILDEYVTDKKNCLGCGICIKKCPAEALSLNRVISNNCISYLTQKKNLTLNDKKILTYSKKIFGCDICQEVCPHNKEIKNTEIEDFNENLLYNINLEDIINLSNKDFKRKYGNRNFSWRGKKIILRNLELQYEQTNKNNK